MGNWFGGAMFLLTMFLMIVSTLNLINWKCPRCEHLFSYPIADRKTCQHCGLAKFADPKTIS
jgi:phage FluMu protein Com